jgi:hypothetical protein
MRRAWSRSALAAVLVAGFAGGCNAIAGIDGLTPCDEDCVEPIASDDATIDTSGDDTAASPDAPAGDATVDALEGAPGKDATLEDSLGDAILDGGLAERPTTYACGPVLQCSLSNPALECCVLFSDSGLPPQNYQYACLGSSACVEAGGPAIGIRCDEGRDCPNPTDVCCWASTAIPRTTYCFAADAGNCAWELCNPLLPVPCVNHPGYDCVPTPIPAIPLEPLGYHVCVKPGGG